MKKAQKKHPLEVWRLDGDDLTTMPFNTAIWLYFNMKSTQTAVLSGFYASEANKQTGRTYSAWDYLNNHLIFLERLIETLEPETKAFYMVEMQIANLTADIERGSNG